MGGFTKVDNYFFDHVMPRVPCADWKVSVTTVKRLRRVGRLRFVYVGQLVRYTSAHLGPLEDVPATGSARNVRKRMPQ